jgi:hypothetical protein
MFHNQETGTTAFALIKDEKRIFGADNTGTWHLHPFEKPEPHEPSEPIGAGTFVRFVEQHYAGTGKSSTE